ncbi:MAG: ABC transporter ATP-binding protein [Eubacterium sp.]
MTNEVILDIKNLSLSIVDEENKDHCILNDVSMEISSGKITCLVGESGSGKSMTMASILGIIPEMAYFGTNSSIAFGGKSIYAIFQDPMNSFNQSIKVGRQLYQMAKGYLNITREAFDVEIRKVLTKLNFDNPALVLEQYPFELSGGMLQRLMIGCGIFIKPSLIIADEPTTALDVTVQKDILKTLMRINREQKITILLVTHDFGVVAEVADEVIVMQSGEIVERNNVFTLFDQPQKDYTKRLIAATFKGETKCY